MRRFFLSFTALAILAACNGEEVDAGPQEAAAAPDGAVEESETEAQQAPETDAAPVPQGAPNVPSQEPAFEGQTRAPQRSSGITLKADRIAPFDEPWGLAILPDGSWLVTERGGSLYHVSTDGAVSEPLAGLPEVDNRDQGGLLDITTGPDFAGDGMVWFTFSEPRGNGTNATALARARLSEARDALEDVEIVFRQEPPWESTKHFGSNIEFDGDGHVYLTLGERSLPEPRQLAQDLSTHLGKVIRLDTDGNVPGDNPFVSYGNARPEIWSFGHRNIQGADVHPQTGRLWTIEHGPRGGDELNVPRPGNNYGWPVITYGEDYDGSPIGEGITGREDMEQPVYYWDPVIAPGDMVFYDGAMFAGWQGDLLIASLKPGAIVRVALDGEEVVGEERLLTNLGRIRDIDVAADGSLLVLTDEEAGGLYRVTPRRG